MAEAVRKAYEEWVQGTVFIEVWLARNGDRPVEEATDFDEHAVYYATNPSKWDALPWFAASTPTRRPTPQPVAPARN